MYGRRLNRLTGTQRRANGLSSSTASHVPIGLLRLTHAISSFSWVEYMAKIMSGQTRDALDKANRAARALARRLQEEQELILPGWTPAPPKKYALRRIVERKVSSGQKVTFQVVEVE